jgi:hypothetical protein
MSDIDFDLVHEVSWAYRDAVKTNAEMSGRDLETEALAAIVGGATWLAYPADRVEAIVKAALHEAADAAGEQR